MAEAVRELLERMVPELEDLRDKGLFSEVSPCRARDDELRFLET